MNSPSLLDTLPPEILLYISDHISQTGDLLHFLCTNRTLHNLLFLEFCKKDITNTGGLAIVAYARNGYKNGVRCMLAAGVKVDVRGAETHSWTALGEAVSAHRLDIAKLLLDHGADIHNTNYWEDPALAASTYETSPQGDMSLFELLLDYGADINASGCRGTPLSMAAHHGDVEMMKFFLSKGAGPNIRYGHRWKKGSKVSGNGSMRMALHLIAAKKTPLEAMTILLNAGAIVDVRDCKGWSPLHLVILADNEVLIDKAKVEALLRFGANVNIPHKLPHRRSQCTCHSSQGPVPGDTALHYAARSECENGAEIMALLLENGADVNAIDRRGCTPLHVARVEKREEEKYRCLEILLRHGADINAQDIPGCTILHYQARALSKDLVKWLCDRGCDVNKQNGFGLTPIFEALQAPNRLSENLARHKLTVVETLISLGATVNQITPESHSPLWLAVRQRCPDLTRLLLEYGADVHHRDRDGNTYLQWVLRIIDWDEVEDGLDESDAIFDRRSLADLLLRHGGDLNDVAPVVCNSGGKELWDLAEIVEYVERKTAEKLSVRPMYFDY